MSLAPLLDASLAIQIHAFAALAALLLGAAILFRRKGTPAHRFWGRLWAGLMLVVATSALFISEMRLVGPFGPIHILVVVTYVGLAQGIWHIRRGNVGAHRASMQGLYLGSMSLAGAFTLLPGRRMNEVLFGAGAGWPPALAAIALALALTAFAWWRLMPRRGGVGSASTLAGN